jgi:DNA-binding transcriptional regulator YdaS (Cro superfamily)
MDWEGPDATIWRYRLDLLRARFGTYRAVARRISVNPQSIANFRAGQCELPGHAKASILIELDQPLCKKDYVSLFPPQHRAIASRAQVLAFPPKRRGNAGNAFWLDLIETLRKRTGAKSDAALATRLGISASNLSLVRSGHGQPSPKTKLMLLEKSRDPLTRALALDLLPPMTAKKLRGWERLRFHSD